MPEETDIDQFEQPTPVATMPAPGVPRSSSGAPLPGPPPNIQWTGAQPPAPSANDLQTQISRMPLEKAQAAYSAALKFQAMRGYQSDLQAGKAPAEALAKWAPLMFTAPREGNLGQAAGMVRAIKPSAPTFRTANGQIFQVGTNGAVPLTPPVQHRQSNEIDAIKYRAKTEEMKELRQSLADDPNAKDKAMKLRRMRALQDEMAEIEKGNTPTAPQWAPASLPQPAPRQGPGTTFIGPKVGARSSSGAPPKVTTQAEYDALPPGSVYISKNGKPHRKPYADRD